jgi:hypothetical protein
MKRLSLIFPGLLLACTIAGGCEDTTHNYYSTLAPADTTALTDSTDCGWHRSRSHHHHGWYCCPWTVAEDSTRTEQQIKRPDYRGNPEIRVGGGSEDGREY